MKARAGLKRQAREDLARLPKRDPSVGVLAFELLSRQVLELDTAPTVKRLLARIDAHGRIATDAEAQEASIPRRRCSRSGHQLRSARSRTTRRRFRQNHDWAAVPWLMLAYARAHDTFAFEVADHALETQDASGAFRTATSPMRRERSPS